MAFTITREGNSIRIAGRLNVSVNNTNRWLVIQGSGETVWLNALPTDPTPNRLMVEYHCYTPFQFTQLSSDASWGNMQCYWGPAYHYAGDPTRNAVAPEAGYIDSGFQRLTDQYVSKGIPVLVGEFQAAAKSFLAVTNTTEAAWNRASAFYWNKYLVDSAHAHGLSPFYWTTPKSPIDLNTGAVYDPQVVSVLPGGTAPPPLNGAPCAPSGLTATGGLLSHTTTIALTLNGATPSNTPPVLAAIANCTVNAGRTVAFTASAADTDQPPQTLTSALHAGATNATLNTNSGAFSFRPLVTQANSTNNFTLKVSDNGTPSLSATQSFAVMVNPLAAPAVSSASTAGGQLGFCISGQSGPDYAIETSTNLTQWSNVFITNSPALPFNWTDATTNSPQRFYRIKLGPPLP